MPSTISKKRFAPPSDTQPVSFPSNPQKFFFFILNPLKEICTRANLSCNCLCVYFMPVDIEIEFCLRRRKREEEKRKEKKGKGGRRREKEGEGGREKKIDIQWKEKKREKFFSTCSAVVWDAIALNEFAAGSTNLWSISLLFSLLSLSLFVRKTKKTLL